jgi:hypothetical protein
MLFFVIGITYLIYKSILLCSDYDYASPSSFWRAYRGTWLRTHFQDWIGTRQDFNKRETGAGSGSGKKDPKNFPEWFETTKDDTTCTTVPATVNAGRPPSDICLAVSLKKTKTLFYLFLIKFI